MKISVGIDEPCHRWHGKISFVGNGFHAAKSNVLLLRHSGHTSRFHIDNQRMKVIDQFLLRFRPGNIP